jgi:alkylation response protein AidB-like acyl-CoA dehydrogenase
MVENLDALCTIIERHRDEAEATARLAPAVREAAGAAGLWVLNAPKEVGGLELSLPEQLMVYERVGQADPTVGWHAANSTVAGLAAARLEEADRRLVFGRTDLPFGYAGAVTGGVRATPDADGFRINGTWPFMTGAADAAWAITTVMVADEDGKPGQPPDVRRFVLPLAELTVHDNWRDASGMRGTGSQSVTAGNVFVPASRAIPISAPTRIDRPLFRVGDGVAFFAAPAAMAVGIVRAGLRGVIDVVSSKVSRFDGHAHYDDVRIQQTVADATAAAECLSAGLARVCGRYWDAIEDGDEPSAALRADLWSVLFATFDVARQQVSNLYTVGTSSTYATRNPVERALRDIHALNAAFDTFQSLRRAAGRSLLGHEANHPRF